MKQLRSKYDETKLIELTEKKDSHKTLEYNRKLEIKQLKQTIRDEEHQIEIINGDIFRLKNIGSEHKQEIINLKNSKTCPTCGQALGREHQEHIQKNIKEIEMKMFDVANQIREKEIEKNPHNELIKSTNTEITKIEEAIQTASDDGRNIS